MGEQMAMLQATLDLIEGAVAVLDTGGEIVFWNKTATELTGYRSADVVGLQCPEDLYSVEQAHLSRGPLVSSAVQPSWSGSYGFTTSDCGCNAQTALLEGEDSNDASQDNMQCPTRVVLHHRLGHTVPGMLRKLVLLDSFDEPLGTALFFYPVEEVDALPHGESAEDASIERSQADMDDRLEAAYHQWKTGGTPFGLLWITVDQAESLRKTHGADACEAMLRTLEHTLLRQMKPAEVLGRWGNNEFLALTHERTLGLMVEHASRLVGLARTAEFRWWGDRVGITLSIGVSHAETKETLQSLLTGARQAMQRSVYAGGNQVAKAREN